LTPGPPQRHTRQRLSSTLQRIPRRSQSAAEPLAPEEASPISARPRPRGRWLRYLGLVPVTFVLVIWLDGWVNRLPPLAGVPAPGERVGVIHVHTNASCGSGSLPQVIEAARDADLSFLAVTDHNLAESEAEVAAADPPEFAVIDGEEVSTSSGHFLALGISSRWLRGSSYDARSLMASARQAGAVNFIAHPYGLKDRWGDWSVKDFDGMEIWNDDAIWRHNSVLAILTSLILYPVNPRLALVRLASTPRENLAKWDELLAQRPVAGICGSDAHASLRVNDRQIARFPSYLSVFSLIRQHLLLEGQGAVENGQTSVDALLAALKNGNAFCAVDALYPADGFTQKVITAGRTAGPGQSISWSPGAVLHVSVPAGADRPIIRVLRDGREIAQRQTHVLDLTLPGAGLYRTEAYLRQPGLSGWHRQTLWIFANPVHVTTQ